MLSPELSARFEESGETFLRARPFRHAVIDNFLDAQFCRRLIDEFPVFDSRKALNEAGALGRKAVNPDLKSLGPAYREFDALMRDGAFLKRVGEVTGVPELLYDAYYVGGGTHENLDGQELDVHVDFNYHPKTFQHRRLNLIVFLNREWDEAWGGSLELCSDPWKLAGEDTVRVLPVANRAVLFETTEHSWHGFSRITLPAERKDLSRRSIAVYFYTKERPPEETAESHGTVYIPRPLPAYVQTGHVLSENDVQELVELTQRRDDQIRFLYQRELRFTKLIAGLTRSASFRIGRGVTWPLRVLRKS
jgi:hypothetical protein